MIIKFDHTGCDEFGIDFSAHVCAMNPNPNPKDDSEEDTKTDANAVVNPSILNGRTGQLPHLTTPKGTG